MGGKTKQSQRTKNNARPSSSWRSADLLSNNVGFSSMSPPTNNAETTLFTAITENTIQSLSNDFILCVKKLNKKDPVSKAKGLQQLAELVKKSSVEETAEFLQHWCRLYPTLSNDVDHKVREATQVCQGAIAMTCGRTIRHHLRQLCAVWTCAQYDCYAPAAAAARTALTSTFPGLKLKEFMAFGRKDVLHYVIHNIVDSDEETIRRQDESEESSRERYALLCHCSLRAVALLCDDDRVAWTQMRPLPDSNKYWKLTHPLVRGAWYEATTALIERFPKEFEAEYGTKCAKYLLNEVNGNCDIQSWECLLMLLQHTKDNKVWSEKSKEFTNRIIELAENGGAGTSPLLLPVMASLPECAISENLYVEYYNAIFNGLEKKCILTSKTERSARLQSASDCLEYICTAHLQQYGPQFIARLFTQWLQKTLNTVRHGQTNKDIVRTSARYYSAHIKQWTTLGHRSLVALVWQNIRRTISQTIDRTDDDDHSEECALLLMTMNEHYIPDEKIERVKFEDEEISARAQTDRRREHPIEIDPAVTRQYEHDLTATVHCAVVRYFELMKRTRRVTTVSTRIMGLLETFNTLMLFMKVAEHMKCDSLYHLYEILYDLVREDASLPSVRLVLLLMEHMTDEERAAIFSTFSQSGQDVAELCVRACIGHGASTRAEWCLRWLKGEAAGDILVDSLDRPRTDAPEMCFTRDGVPLVSEETLLRVMSRSSAILRHAATERTVAVAAVLLSELTDHAHMYDSYCTLVRDMFALTLRYDETSLSAAAYHDALSCWKNALASSRQTRRPRLVHALIRTTHDLLGSERSVGEIEHVANVCSELIDECEFDSVVDITLSLMAHDNDIDITQYALEYDCLVSKLDGSRTRPSSEEPSPRCLSHCSNRDVFDAVLLENVASGERTAALLRDSRVADSYVAVLRNAVVWDAVSAACLYSPPMHARAALVRDRLSACIRRTVLVMDDATRDALTATVARHAARGRHWAYAAASWCREADAASPPADEGDTDDDSFYHRLQANEDERRWELVALHDLEIAFPRETAGVRYEGDVLDYIAELYYKHRHVLALDRDISESPWSHAVAVAAVAECFRAEVCARGWTLEETHWDMINISLCGFVTALRCSRRHHYAQVAMLCRSVLRLYSAVDEFISSVPARSVRERPSGHVSDLPKEWTEVFLPNILENLFDIISDALDDAVPADDMTSARHVYLTALEDVTPRLTTTPRRPVSVVMRHCVEALAARCHYKYKHLAYNVLLLSSPSLLRHDAETLSISNEDVYVDDDADAVTEEAMNGCFVNALLPYYERLYDELRDCEESQGSRYSAALGLTLLGHAMMDITNAARGNLALLYIRTYSRNETVSSLMSWSERLLPERPSACWFTEESRRSLSEPADERALSRLACRGVWLAAHTKAAAVDAGIEELVRKFVTPLAVENHLREAAALDGEELSVRVSPSTREVHCTRRLDDASAELTIQLSSCHPLRPPRHTVRSGPALHPHRLHLAHQRGSVRDMVRWWSQAVQRWVHRAPVCCICYGRLHSDSGRLPSVLCKVCKYKFHTQCLQKWFNTSKDIKCPHCRSPFQNHNMYNSTQRANRAREPH